MINGELLVDNFAGGGGASTGIEIATGYSVDIAINHDPEAIRMHKANHPATRHYCESVWDVDPVKICAGHPVALAWFSPDCKHFSKAKGGKPVEKKIRGLAWIVLKWAALVRPRVIMLENVEEFQTWGPCMPERDKKTGRVIINITGQNDRKKNESRTRIAEPGEVVPVNLQVFTPDPKRKGHTYRKWRKQLEALGYKIETRELKAADYGAPTMRKRFFMIARCDGKPIVWPEPTHAPRNSEAVMKGLLKPYVGAYTQIDFSHPCPSIFDTTQEIKDKYGIRAVRPLAPKTMERIARGLKKFVIDNAEPFVVQVNHSGVEVVEPYIVQIGQTGFTNDRSKDIREPLTTIVSKNEHCLINPILIQYHSETAAGEVRGQNVTEPIMTVDSSNRYGLVTSFLQKFYDGGYIGADGILKNPLPTIKEVDHKIYATHLIQMNNHCDGRDITHPIPTITAGDGHFGEVRAFLIKYYGQGTGQEVTSGEE